MKLCGIETTPNPNCMMLKVDEEFGDRPLTFDAGGADLDRAPAVARALLSVDGVRSVFLSRDFITLTRRGGADWKPILDSAARLLGRSAPANVAWVPPDTATVEPHRVEIAVLEFRGLPSQVRAFGAGSQARVALPERFATELARVLASTNANYLKERSWRPRDPGWGDPAEVAQMVADEIESSIADDELSLRGAAAIAGLALDQAPRPRRSQEDLLADLSSADPRLRLAAIQVIKVDDTSFAALVGALADDGAAVRRWAAASLGSSKRPEAVAPLCDTVVSDSSVIVRRTAGDALSDLGDLAAIPAMCRALADRSPLVRWRAARYLNERGDASALGALDKLVEAEADFGVRAEMAAAIERIRGGGASQVPMWLRLARGDRQA